jgi:hypothetical protein
MVDMQIGLTDRYGEVVQQPFKCSAYPAYAANLGPRVACKQHKDSCNSPATMCAVTALGQFNPDVEGHLILHDLKVYIRFPPGSTILLLSASIEHANIPVCTKDATQTSFTQYCPGGLMRHFTYGYKTWTQLLDEEKAAIRAGDADRLQCILDSFVVIDVD